MSLIVNEHCNRSMPCAQRFADMTTLYAAQGSISLAVVSPAEFEGEPVAIAQARNYLIRSVNTTYLLLFDDDDLPEPSMLQKMRTSAIRTNADAVTCFCANVLAHRWQQSSNTQQIESTSLAAGDTGIVGGFVIHHAGKANLLLKVEFVRRVGGCLPELLFPTPFVDWGLYVRITLNRGILSVLPEPLYYYRKSNANSIYYSATGLHKYIAHRKLINLYCEQLVLNTQHCELLWYAAQQVSMDW